MNVRTDAERVDENGTARFDCVRMGFRPDVDLTILPTWTFWPVYAVQAHYWLGVAYEQKGDKVKAIQEYETFLDTWKNADPGIAEIAEAKERLAQLRKEG